MDLLRSVVSTLATTVSLRLCYAVLTALGSTLVLPQTHGEAAGWPGVLPPVPSILHLAHAAIAALLLAVTFTPLFRPQGIMAENHPIARKCLAQFLAGWRWAWVTWLALYCWLWVHAGAGGGPDVVRSAPGRRLRFPSCPPAHLRSPARAGQSVGAAKYPHRRN